MGALWLSLHTNTTILQGKLICQIVCFLNQGTIIKSDSSVASFAFRPPQRKKPHQKAIFLLILFNKIAFYYFPRRRPSLRAVPVHPEYFFTPLGAWSSRCDPGGRANKCKINGGKIKMNGIRMTPRRREVLWNDLNKYGGDEGGVIRGGHFSRFIGKRIGWLLGCQPER